MTKSNHTQKSKKPIIITSIIVIILVATAILLYFFVFNKTSNNSVAVIEKNKDNAKTLEAEKEQENIVITDDVGNEAEKEVGVGSPQQDVDTTPQPTYDDYGPSTKLDRPDVHGVVLSVYPIYRDFLYKLQTTPQDQRQAVADQYIADNSSIIGANFNYLSSDTLHLFPQGANIALPNSIRVNSAIVDPENPNQVIVQIIMQPDVPWSILVVVKVKDSLRNFGTIEKLIPRMNLNPL